MASQQYALWRRKRGAAGKWERVLSQDGRPMATYHKQTAIRVYQNRLILNSLGELEPTYEYQLRIAKGGK